LHEKLWDDIEKDKQFHYLKRSENEILISPNDMLDRFSSLINKNCPLPTPSISSDKTKDLILPRPGSGLTQLLVDGFGKASRFLDHEHRVDKRRRQWQGETQNVIKELQVLKVRNESNCSYRDSCIISWKEWGGEWGDEIEEEP
jgi:hypothetical protein